ncbi:MAG: hypothetical protein O7D91_05185 [Planctomycetota bacterium]|nr:hypothetical protein [Planctomycetota bacterium]
MAMSWRWESLHGLGELRLLRVSYVVLIGVPALSAAANWWNEHAIHHWTNLSTIRSDALSGIETFVEDADATPGALSDPNIAMLRNWTRSAAKITAKEELWDALNDANSLLKTFSSKACAKNLGDWVIEASRQLEIPAWGRFEFPVRVRWLYLAMVVISLANLVYSGFCPPILRLLNYAPRTRGAGFGDEVDWCLTLYDQIKGADDPRERRLLFVDLLNVERRKKMVGITEVGNNREWVIARWMQLQRSAPVARVCCMFSYVSGLTITLCVIALQTYLVFRS